jgi:hypothetical protein
MAAPTPLAEKFVNCIDSTFTIGTDPDTIALVIIDGGFTHTYNVDDMTNNQSGGCYEDVKTIQMAEGRCTAGRLASGAPGFKAGDIFHVVIAKPGSGMPTFTGNVRFNAVESPLLDVKAGLKYNFTWKNQGSFTVNY